MIWIQFLATALVIVFAGVRLARYGDVLGEKTGLGRSWVGVVLLAATTSLPELFTGFGATALANLPDIAVGDVLGSCMFNVLILSFMDAVQPEPLSTRAHQGHALSIGFGLVLIGVAGLGLLGGTRLQTFGGIGLYTPVLFGVYFLSMRLIFTHEQHRRAREAQEVAEECEALAERIGEPSRPAMLTRMWRLIATISAGPTLSNVPPTSCTSPDKMQIRSSPGTLSLTCPKARGKTP